MRYKSMRIFFWCAAIALGCANAWATRFAMNPDGISYLDMGEAYLRGDWHRAINAWWSPMYSCFLGAFLKLLNPSPYWEFPVVHLVNLLIYIAALASYEFFLGSFLDGRAASQPARIEGGGAPLPDWAWRALGYSVFIWTSLMLITVRLATPDMCVAAFVYLASGLIVRIRSGTASSATFVLLGIVLGLGYLAKAVMFPLAFVFLGVALLATGPFRKAARRVSVSLMVFLLIAAPFIVALSLSKGRPTFGDSGRVDYAVYVGGVDLFVPEGGSLKHPVRRIFEKPAAFEFAQPIGGTYPLWYDPSYWHEGIAPRFDLKGQVEVITEALKLYCLLFIRASLQLNLTVGLVLLVLAAGRPVSWLRAVLGEWPLLIPSLSIFGIYALVVSEYRFLGAFVCLLWTALFSGVRVPEGRWPRTWAVGVVVAMAATTGLSAVSATVQNLADPRNRSLRYLQAALALNEQGIEPGDKLAVITGVPFGDGGAFFARLSRAQIIAEVKRPEDFWASPPSVRSQVIDALARTGAKAIVTSAAPPDPIAEPDWKRLGQTEYHVRRLDPR